MKQTTLTLFMVAFVIMLTTPFAVKPHFKTQKVAVQINYYWFDPNTVYSHQATLATEEANTGWNESTQNPKTLQEKGWAPGNVTFDGSGTPVPITGTPDKILYSHP
ncbi:hypothetical protein A3860_28915 [Niastella vici]|uniref:Uncharacterized protein n=1 Tax=Niastella vici TaxID=1703345 RepID=A0A1V9FVK6_9BACT|nr:hypothetical protein [Niastella vici]OQP62382.1 hypothetical protein A3860_28915 [Niastella vici]